MKQMRSRFRLITLLLVCGFLLTAALCTGNLLKASGVSLSALPGLLRPAESPSPSLSPSGSPGPESTIAPTPSGSVSPDAPAPEADGTPAPLYNVFGL